MERYPWKEIPGSSHDVLRRRLRALPSPVRLLDVGAAGGYLGRAVRDCCSFLAGIEPDPAVLPAARAGYDEWRTTDVLDAGEWREPFDAIVCADVLEHLPQPDRLLERLRTWLKPGGLLLISIPNVANISIRLALLVGRFEYASRGILDRSHLRFFTRSSARRLLNANGFFVREVEATAMPCELALPALGRFPWRGPVRIAALLSARVWPALFGYQFVFEAETR
jgi:2-polyprenyl-3-methyl-5-hydroxy-6-metoxy-1,4-benzoquinol methylase